MNSFLTGNKDVDNLILEQLEDKELLQICLVDKYANHLCNNDSFWKKRFIDKYGKANLKYNSSNTHWKKFYLSILSFPNLSYSNLTEEEKIMMPDVNRFLKAKHNTNNSNNSNNDMDFIIVNLPEGFVVNHERWSNKRFEHDFRTFKLFWTSPGNKSYYGGNLLKYKFVLAKPMTGIKLTSPASDFEKQVSSHTNIPKYDLPNVDDAFRNLWYGILEKDLLGFNVDFINLYDEEIIFSYKNLKYLVEV